MQHSDPLALRHGPLIGQVWEQIALARRAAMRPLPEGRAAFWQRRLRHVHRQVMKAHQSEMQRPDAEQSQVDDWFSPVTATLARAETHFGAVLAAETMRDQAPPVKSGSAR